MSFGFLDKKSLLLFGKQSLTAASDEQERMRG